MSVSPVITNIKGFSLIRVILFHEHSTMTHLRNISSNLLNHICLGHFWDTFPILQTSRGFAIQYLRSKTSATFTKWNSLPASPLFCRPRVFRQELSVGKTSNSSEVCTVIQHVHAEAEVTYICKLSEITSERIVFAVFPGCSMMLSCLELLILDLPKSHPQSLGHLSA